MIQLCLNCNKILLIVIFTIFTVMTYNVSAHAGEADMKINLTSISELMSKWSNQLSTGNVDAKSQKKMGELMSRMSQVLQEMTGSGGSDMHMQHRDKITAMHEEWKPFDTSDRN